jgi:hypothetical protein
MGLKDNFSGYPHEYQDKPECLVCLTIFLTSASFRFDSVDVDEYLLD